MQHTIPLSRYEKTLGPQVRHMAQAVEACVHCGFCLPVCPTYQVLGEEMDSPRGRIVLMKSVLEGELRLGEALPYLDRCLGCLACVTACPSGVRYGDLITPFRAFARSQDGDTMGAKVQHTLLTQTLPYVGRFRAAAFAGRLAKPLRRLLPASLRTMIDLLPERLPPSAPLPAVYPAQGKRRARVALLVGCVQQGMAPQINWATLRVLAQNGVEVLIPTGQGCCGALLIHTGDHAQARTLARRNMAVFPQDVDAILANAAGCGSGMKEYPFLFEGEEDEEQARAFAALVQDVHVFLADLGLQEVPPLPLPLRVAYHDACHLAHAQGVTAQPRQLLQAIPNLTLLEIADSTLCCGSAGSYNVEQPEIAAVLGERKVHHILESGAEAVVAANIGCLVQIRAHLEQKGKLLPLFHPLELLDLAYAQRFRA